MISTTLIREFETRSEPGKGYDLENLFEWDRNGSKDMC